VSPLSRLPITAGSIHFYVRNDGYTDFDRSEDRRINAFGWWVTDDLQGGLSSIAKIADAVAHHMAQSDAELFERNGNAWVAIVTDKMTLENKFNDTREDLTLAEAATLLHAYWNYSVEKKSAQWIHKELRFFREEYGREPVFPWADGDGQVD
jgi:hypothetical protein